MSSLTPIRRKPNRTAALLTGAALSITMLSACDENGEFAMSMPKAKKEAGANAGGATKKRMVEREVEAPEVFSAEADALWDGRPSLGGIWIAHPDVTDPERVRIRNTASGKTVTGALFRRERELPGPKFQLSSDAASELGILAGSPTRVNVVVLRRQETEEEVTELPAPMDAEANPIAAPADVEQTTLDPIASAAAAIEKPAEPAKAQPEKPTEAKAKDAAMATADGTADAAQAAAGAAAAAAPAPEAKPEKKSRLPKPYVQAGIFEEKDQAMQVARQLSAAGLSPVVKKSQVGEKELWRVVVGPAKNRFAHGRLMRKTKAAGFTDAYAVSD